MQRTHRIAAATLSVVLSVGAVTTAGAAESAAPLAPLLHYSFDELAHDGDAVPAGSPIADVAGAHPGTVRGAGATVVAGPRGDTDRALDLAGGSAASGAAYVDIAAGVLPATATSITLSAWTKWDGGQGCAWLYALGRSDSNYVFATPDCGNTMIGAVKSGTEDRASDNQPLPATRWVHVAVVLEGGSRITSYVGGEQVATRATASTAQAALGDATRSGYLGKSFYGADPLFAGVIDDFQVFGSALSAAQIVELGSATSASLIHSDIAAIDLGDVSAVTDSLTLPTAGANGSQVTWASSDAATVASTGQVTRPAIGAPDRVVMLTPTLSLGGVTRTADAIAVTVVADTPSEASDRLRARLIVPSIVKSGYLLPSVAGLDIQWSVDAGALSSGRLVNTAAAATTVAVTATARLGDDDLVKTFSVSVLPTSLARTVVAYNRTPSGVDQANQDSVARSLHLALGPDAATALPLNENFGVLYAESVYTGVDLTDGRALADASVFTFADGTAGVIATRTRANGASDGTDSSSALIFKAPVAGVFADFDELGLIDLGTRDGVAAPRAVFDSAEQRYLVSWTDRAGMARHVTVDDLARTASVSEPFSPYGGVRSIVVADGNRGAVGVGAPIVTEEAVSASFASRVPNADPANAITISQATAASLEGRYGRITNTTVTAPDQALAASEIAKLDGVRAELGYSDGSTATRGITWNRTQLDALKSAAPGTYTLTGTVSQPQYPQVFAANRADPAAYKYTRGGVTKYLFIATDDTNNWNIGSEHLPIRVSDTLAGLADANGGRANEIDLLNRVTRGERTAEGRKMAGCYWAPEFHEIGGKLSILFAPCFSGSGPDSTDNPAFTTVQSHIMQLRDGGNPATPADWSVPAAILNADGTPLGRKGFAAGNISLDMTVVTDAGKTFYVWSQRYLPVAGGQPIGDPLTWIAEVDPTNPTRITTAPAPIIAPGLSFEEKLTEGAFALYRDGKIHLVYSGSGVSPTYIVGGVWAYAGSDLTDIDSWHKYNAPLHKSQPMPAGVRDYRTYEQGPGHGAFTRDEDGNELYVYHAWGDGVDGDGRDARTNRVHWAADGQIILDMTRNEEVAPENRSVTISVTLRNPLAVTATASTRCVAGKVVVTTTTKNGGATAVNVGTVSSFGSRTTSLAAGKSSSTVFSTRQTSIGAAEVVVTATATTAMAGTPETTVVRAPFAARSCR